MEWVYWWKDKVAIFMHPQFFDFWSKLHHIFNGGAIHSGEATFQIFLQSFLRYEQSSFQKTSCVFSYFFLFFFISHTLKISLLRKISVNLINICDPASKNRSCGLKYILSFDETYLNTEMWYLDSVSSVVKQNKLLTNLENFVAVPYWKKKLWEPKVWKVVKF